MGKLSYREEDLFNAVSGERALFLAPSPIPNNHSGFWLMFFSEANVFSKHSEIWSHYVRSRDRTAFQTWSVPSWLCLCAYSISPGCLGGSASQGVGWAFAGLAWLFNVSLCPVLLSWVLIANINPLSAQPHLRACFRRAQPVTQKRLRSEFPPSLF